MARKRYTSARPRFEEPIRINTGRGLVEGNLAVPESSRGAIIFAHGSGSERHSPRNRFVAQVLHDAGLATLLMDLLTVEEEQVDQITAQHRFNIELLAERLVGATDWLNVNFRSHAFRVGYFGASTGATAALVAAAKRPEVAAVVSRGGRPDLAGDSLRTVRAAVLLIVGANDERGIGLNRAAYRDLTGARLREVKIVPGAGHRFEERGTLSETARLAVQWFNHYLSGHRLPASQFAENSHITESSHGATSAEEST